MGWFRPLTWQRDYYFSALCTRLPNTHSRSADGSDYTDKITPYFRIQWQLHAAIRPTSATHREHYCSIYISICTKELMWQSACWNVGDKWEPRVVTTAHAMWEMRHGKRFPHGKLVHNDTSLQVQKAFEFFRNEAMLILNPCNVEAFRS